MSSAKKSITILNKEIEVILAQSDGAEETIKHLKKDFQRLFIRRFVQFFVFLALFSAAVCLLVYYVPSLNWNASAIGRIALIKLILPTYNWQHLYDSRCLIEMAPIHRIEKSEQFENYDEFKDQYCTVCENLGNIQSVVVQIISLLIYVSIADAIDRISNTSFGNLHDIYLVRDHPVIVSDSHNADDVPEDFVEFLQSFPQLKYSMPCNIATNLLQIRNRQPNLKNIFQQTKRIGTKEWFLHFRNCEFEAVKASRGVFPHKYRPYFLSNHLPPFYSSWVLISKQYKIMDEMRLLLKDLVFVFQLKGKLTGRLFVQEQCKFFCDNQDFQLNAGETLIFNAEMWDFYYHNNNSQLHAESLAVTFIQEIRVD